LKSGKKHKVRGSKARVAGDFAKKEKASEGGYIFREKKENSFTPTKKRFVLVARNKSLSGKGG